MIVIKNFCINTQIQAVIKITLLFLILLSIPPFFSYAQDDLWIDGASKKKAISIIFDDSTSMLKDDNTKKPVTRWVEADYALKAFIAMMDPGDKLNFYVTSGTKERSEYDLTEGASRVIDRINDEMMGMEHVDGTPFACVESTMEYMEGAYDPSEYDCWIVILTDGMFTDIGGANRAEREKQFNDKMETLAENTQVSLAYIPIGKDTFALSESMHEKIITPKEYAAIQDQVIDVINQIYGRMEVDDSKVKTAGGFREFCLDIPIENAILFVQDNSEEMDYEERDLERLKRELSEAELDITGSFRESQKPCFFTGKEDLTKRDIEYAGTPKYRELKGKVYRWEKSSEDVADSMTVRMAETSTLNANGTMLATMYYQPDVDVKLEFWQNGGEIVHGKNCGEMEENGDETERCVEAGEFTLKLVMRDSHQTEIKETDSSLLRLEEFQVTMTRADGGEVTPISQKAGKEYRYPVIEGEYRITVTSPWKQTIEKRILVGEKRKPISIELKEKSEIWISPLENEASILSIQVKEDGQLIGKEHGSQVLSVNALCLSEGFLVEELGMNESGTWDFRVWLKDRDIFDVADDVDILFSAAHLYENSEDESCEMEISIPIRSNPPQIQAEFGKEAADRHHRRILLGEKIPLDFYCDETLLGKADKERVSITNLKVEPAEMKEWFFIDEDNDLHIKRSLEWWEPKADEVTISMQLKFERWNAEGEGSFTDRLVIKYIPEKIKKGEISLAAFAAVWVVLCLLKPFTPGFVKSFEPSLQLEERGFPLEARLCRKRHLMIPFWKKAYVKYEPLKGEEDPYINAFQLDIVKNREGDGWELANYDKFGDSSLYTIDGLPITDNHRVFSSHKRFALKDKDGCWFELKIKG